MPAIGPLSSFRRIALAAEAVFGFGKAEERSPEQAVDGDDHERHDDGGEQEDGEAAAVSGGADL